MQEAALAEEQGEKEEEEEEKEQEAGSDVDWGSSDTEAEMPPTMPAAPSHTEASDTYTFAPARPLTSPASPKRRKVQGKTPPPCMVPAGFIAIRPGLHPESRLSRELGCSIFVVAFKTLRGKPGKLLPLQVVGTPCPHPPIHLVAGKESGSTYYAAKPLWHSPSARAVLEACADVQEAYKRLVLLLSPSTTKGFAAAAHVEKSPDIHHAGVAVTDGQSDVSPELAKQIGLLPPEASLDKPCLYSAWQIRGILPASGESCLCKGMLMVNTAMSRGMRLRDQSRKVHWPAGHLIAADMQQQELCVFYH